MFFALLHEEGFVGIVDEVVEQGVAVHCLVRQRRTLVYVWVHAHWGTVYYDVILLDNLRGDFFLLDSTRTLVSTHEGCFQSERFQTEVDSL